jgi:hypothetical protein
MKIQETQFKELQIFLMNDQPFTCPMCGARCNELANFIHTKARLMIQECMNSVCGFRCIEQENEYCLKLWGII